MKRHIFTLFLLSFNFCWAQFGLSEIKIELNDKKFTKRLNDSIHSSISNGKLITFLDKEFYVMASSTELQEIISKARMTNGKITGLKAIVEWDTFKKEAIIMGYSPMYKNQPDSLSFYYSTDFEYAFGKEVYQKIKKKTLKSFYQIIDNKGYGLDSDATTTREILLKEYNCIHQFDLSYLPSFIFYEATGSTLTMYETSQLKSRLTLSEIYEKYGINNKNHKTLSVDTILINEKWISQTKAHNPTEKQTNPLPYKMDYLKKEINAIGLKLPCNKTLWLSYKEYAGLMKTNDSDKRKFDVYNLYFESAFCKKINANIFIK